MKCLDLLQDWERGRYRVGAATYRAVEEFEAFAGHAPTEARAAYDRLGDRPLESSGVTQFQVRGSNCGSLWELCATGSYHIWYIVDMTNMSVSIIATRQSYSTSGFERSRVERKNSFERIETAIIKSIKEAVDMEPLRVPDWAQPARVQQVKNMDD